MHCHSNLAHIEIPKDAKKIVLVGNPNVGKSVFFNFLTGIYVDVSNFPGTTVDISHGRLGRDVVIDTPGVYGISSFNDEEIVARDVILSADLILNVVDAVHLERDLFLTLQVIDTGIPVIVAVNMVDEARALGIDIRFEQLAAQLGVPVIPTVAVKGQGLDSVKRRLFEARPGLVPAALEHAIEPLAAQIGSRSEALLVLEGDPHVAARHQVKPGMQREEVYQDRRRRVDAIIAATVREGREGLSFAARLGRAMLQPLTGIPFFLLVLVAMYYLIGVLVAKDIVGFTEQTVMQGWYEPAVRALLTPYITEESLLGAFLIGEYGLLTMTVTYIFGLLLPLVAGFYLALSIMEDSGYLPRLATLVDRLMNSIGLNGRAIIPIILGFGCVTMAAITTRILGTQRERTIAIAVLGLAIPCSAQLGVIAGMLANLGTAYVFLYVGTMVLVLGVVGKVLNAVLPGQSSQLLIDLPPIRLPRAENVLTKTVTKSYAFIKEAAPLFMLGAALITALEVSGALVAIQAWLAPVTEGILLLPRETATVFIMGLIRRDFGAAGLNDMALPPAETLIALITITLFVPCIASMIVILKERGKVEGTLVWVGSWVAAFCIGGIVARLIL